MADVESKPKNALWRREEQLKRWNLSETNREKSCPKADNDLKVNFQEGCVFLAACASGDLEEVCKVLRSGADINTTNVDGLTALHQACIDDNLEMVRFLIENGADIDAADNEGWTALHATASCGLVDIARHLVEQGANIVAVNNDGELAFDIAEGQETRDMLQTFMDKQGVDADQAREEEEVLMLEHAKQWVEMAHVEETPHPKTGATALHVAAAKGYIKVLQLTIQAGADVNVQDLDGWTPLHAAAHWAQADACQLLATSLCEMHCHNKSGQTAFDVADADVEDLLQELDEKQKQLREEKAAREEAVSKFAPQPIRRRSSVTRMSMEQKYSHMEQTRARLEERIEPARNSGSSSEGSDTEVPNQEIAKQNEMNRKESESRKNTDASPESLKREINTPVITDSAKLLRERLGESVHMTRLPKESSSELASDVTKTPPTTSSSSVSSSATSPEPAALRTGVMATTVSSSSAKTTEASSGLISTSRAPAVISSTSTTTSPGGTPMTSHISADTLSGGGSSDSSLTHLSVVKLLGNSDCDGATGGETSLNYVIKSADLSEAETLHTIADTSTYNARVVSCVDTTKNSEKVLVARRKLWGRSASEVCESGGEYSGLTDVSHPTNLVLVTVTDSGGVIKSGAVLSADIEVKTMVATSNKEPKVLRTSPNFQPKKEKINSLKHPPVVMQNLSLSERRAARRAANRDVTVESIRRRPGSTSSVDDVSRRYAAYIPRRNIMSTSSSTSAATITFEPSIIPPPRNNRRTDLVRSDLGGGRGGEVKTTSVTTSTSSIGSSGTGTTTSAGPTPPRRFEIPRRDEERETERKARAKRARETRRSTQGVTKDDLQQAEQTLNQVPTEDTVGDKENKPVSPVSRKPEPSTSPSSTEVSSVINRNIYGSSNGSGDTSSGLSYLRSLRSSAPNNQTAEQQPPKVLRSQSSVEKPSDGDDQSQKCSAIRARRKRENRRPTGKISPEDIHGNEDEKKTSELETAKLSSRLQSEQNDYKKLYEESQSDVEILKRKLRNAEQEGRMRKEELDKLRTSRDFGATSSCAEDARQKRSLQRRVSELEEEVKKMEVLRADNLRLKEENGALIRVISKLSK